MKPAESQLAATLPAPRVVTGENYETKPILNKPPIINCQGVASSTPIRR